MFQEEQSQRLPPLKWPDLPHQPHRGLLRFGCLIQCLGCALVTLGLLLMVVTESWRWLMLVVPASVGVLAVLRMGMRAHSREAELYAAPVREQLAGRGDVPPEVWGTDPDRRQMAAEILEHLASANTYSDARNFIPDDPFDIVMSLPSGQEYAVPQLEYLGGTVLGDKQVLGTPSDVETKTLGEVVDFLVEQRGLADADKT